MMGLGKGNGTLKKWQFGVSMLDFRGGNCLPLGNLPSQKERILFQPSFFRGELLNLGGVLKKGVWL